MSELSCVGTPYPQLSSDLNAKEIKLFFVNLLNSKSKLLYPHCTSAQQCAAVWCSVVWWQV